MGRYCGKELPETLVSTYNQLHLVFASDVSLHGKGFKGNYSFVDVECGGIIKSPDSIVKSPMDVDGTGVYKSNLFCQWVVIAPPEHIVQINFIAFEIEEDKECKYDYVQIFNNGSERAESLGRFCGSTIPAVLTSTDNVVTIVFKTDESTSRNGFSASFSFLEASKLCGANYFSSTGIIKSPGTDEYLPNKNCEWVITVPNGQQIELIIKSFEMETHSQCRFDGLEIRNGGNLQVIKYFH